MNEMHEFCTLSLLLSLLLNDLTKGNNQLRHIVGGINAIGELFCSLGRLQWGLVHQADFSFYTSSKFFWASACLDKTSLIVLIRFSSTSWKVFITTAIPKEDSSYSHQSCACIPPYTSGSSPPPSWQALRSEHSSQPTDWSFDYPTPSYSPEHHTESFTAFPLFAFSSMAWIAALTSSVLRATSSLAFCKSSSYWTLRLYDDCQERMSNTWYLFFPYSPTSSLYFSNRQADSSKKEWLLPWESWCNSDDPEYEQNSKNRSMKIRYTVS